jgi:threonyl-tRNA synthetase
MLVLGDREMEKGQVAVRERTKGDIGGMSLDEFKQMAQRLVETRALPNTQFQAPSLEFHLNLKPGT